MKYSNEIIQYDQLELSSDVANALRELDSEEKNSDRRWNAHRNNGDFYDTEYRLFYNDIYLFHDNQNNTYDFWLDNINDDKLSDILNTLSISEKELLTKIFFEQRSVIEIASLLDKSTSAIYKRLDKLVKKIRIMYDNNLLNN